MASSVETAAADEIVASRPERLSVSSSRNAASKSMPSQISSGWSLVNSVFGFEELWTQLIARCPHLDMEAKLPFNERMDIHSVVVVE